jgi:DNA (cytosine-5)-methyltransferase 1
MREGMTARLLDLFCGAGGAAMGYHRAGFDIVGVDIEPQPNYPFEFWQMDALKFAGTVDLTHFDLIHASPPCQEFVALSVNRWGKESARWPDLIAPTRELLEKSGVPYVIENVTGARQALRAPMLLTGAMFGLSVHRPRLFELAGWFAMSPPPARRLETSVAVYGKPDGRKLWTREDGSELRAWSSLEEGREALGVPWMQTELEVREAIPPAYTKFIGEQFLEVSDVA